MIKKRFFLFVIIAYVALALVAFGKLPKTFFQQDEWAILGNTIYADKAQLSLFDRLFIYEQDTHLIPLSNATTLALYRLFGVWFAPWAAAAIFFQVINAVLVSILAQKLLRHRIVAGGAGAIFLLNSISHQAVTWLATTVGTVGSTLFFLLSLIAFVNYLEEKKPKLMGLLTVLFFLISLSFKETSIFGFILFPAWFFILARPKSLKKILSPALLMGLVAASYAAARVFFRALSPPIAVTPELSQAPLGAYIFRLFAIPVRAIAQSFVPTKLILLFSRGLIYLAYPQFLIAGSPDPYVVESAASDIISLLAAAVIFLLSFVLLRIYIAKKKREVAVVIVLMLVSIAASALPFLVVPGKAGYNALLDGRHLYLTGIFSSILLAAIWWGLFLRFGKRKVAFLILGGIFLLSLGYHALKIRRDIAYQVAIGQLRKSILAKIITSYPVLPQRTVFFVESDAPYYGLPYEEPIVPFQSGFGQVLLVWYNARGQNLPACFFDKKYLYVLLEERFKECEGRGFGYFRKTATFNENLKKYKFKPEEVFAFRFTSATNALDDITIQVRQTLVRSGQL